MTALHSHSFSQRERQSVFTLFKQAPALAQTRPLFALQSIGQLTLARRSYASRQRISGPVEAGS
jgi:hypothetical protein